MIRHDDHCRSLVRGIHDTRQRLIKRGIKRLDAVLQIALIAESGMIGIVESPKHVRVLIDG